MIAPAPISSPRELGAALRAARERKGVRIESIADRTKIARRVLELLEAGEFAKLPNRVFVRLFLQQYLAIIGEPAEEWTARFETAWQRFEDASQPWEVVTPAPTRGGRWLPWLIGFVVVAGGLAGVLLVEQRPAENDATAVRAQTPRAMPSPIPSASPSAAPSAGLPASVAPVSPTTEPPLQPTPVQAAPEPPAERDALVLKALGRPCWVEVRIERGRAESRLLPAGAEWRVAAGGREVTLVAGDGGALQFEYLGERHDRVGGDGEVVRLHLGPASAPAGPLK